MSSASSDNLFERHGGHYHRHPLYLWLGRMFPQQRVLELDCGSGEGVALLGAGRSRLAVGYDTDREAVERARRRHGGPGVDFRSGSGDDLPFESALFDVVLALRRPFDPFQAPRIREILRVLRPGGVLVAALPNPAHAALPVPGSHDAPVPVTITAHQLQLELARHFPEVRLLAQSPLMGFVVHDLRTPEAAIDRVRLDATLAEGHLDETYAWLGLCSTQPLQPPEPLLVRLRFDQLVDVLRAQGEEEFERAGRVLGDEPAFLGFEERLADMHRHPDSPSSPRSLTPSGWAAPGALPLLPHAGAGGEAHSSPVFDERELAPSSWGEASASASPGAVAVAAELAGTLTAELDELRGLCAQHARGGDKARDRLGALERRIRELTADAAALADTERELRQAVEAGRAEAAELRSTLAERSAALEAAEGRANELRAELSATQAERQAANEADLQIEIEDLRDAWRADRDELRESRAAHQRVERELLAVRQQIMMQDDLVRSAEEAKADLTRQISALQADLEEQRAAAAASAASAAQARKEASQAATEQAAQQAKELANFRDERVFLEEELRRIDEENARLRHELTVAREALSSASESAHADLEARIEREQRVRERIAAELGERLEYLTTTLDSGRERVDQVAAWVDEAMRKVDGLQSRLP